MDCKEDVADWRASDRNQSRNHNQDLATTMFSMLPREIRDMIYVFWLQGECDNIVVIRRRPTDLSFFSQTCLGPKVYKW